MRTLASALAASCLLLAGVARADEAKILYVGMDGADTDVIQPMLDAGELPNIAALVEAGSMTELISHMPTRSPAVWTTLATGVRKEKHGIYDYITNSYYWPDELKTKEKNLATSEMRKVPALWTLLSDADKATVAAGWLSTWPAEKTKGAIVAPYIDLGSKRQTTIKGAIYKTDAPRQMHDPKAFAKLQPRLKKPSDFGATARKLYFDHPPKDSPLFEDSPILERYAYTVDWTEARMHNNTESVLALSAEHDPSLVMVYYHCPDSLGHRYWVFRQPTTAVAARLKSLGKNPKHAAELKRRYGKTVDNCYKRIDEHLGRIRQQLGDGWSTMIVSDHGFGNCEKGCAAKGVPFNGGHQNNGTIILSGPAFQKGAAPKKPVVEDAPVTILKVLGVPIPEHVDGRVLTESLTPTPERAQSH